MCGLKKHLKQADYLAEKQKRNNFRRYLLHALKQLNEGLPDDAYLPPALLVLRLWERLFFLQTIRGLYKCCLYHV